LSSSHVKIGIIGDMSTKRRTHSCKTDYGCIMMMKRTDGNILNAIFFKNRSKLKGTVKNCQI